MGLGWARFAWVKVLGSSTFTHHLNADLTVSSGPFKGDTHECMSALKNTDRSSAGPALTFDGDLFALEVIQVAQQHLLPVTPVADEAQVGQGALRWAHLLFHFGQQVTLKIADQKELYFFCWLHSYQNIPSSHWGNMDTDRIQSTSEMSDSKS